MENHIKQVLMYAPGMLGNDIVNFALDNFKRQGWLGARLTPWRQRRNRNRAGRAILIKSGRLRRSIRVVSASKGVVIVGSDVPYAKAHNEGFRGVVTVKGHTRGKYTKSKVGTGKFTKKGNERKKTVTTQTGQYAVKSHRRRMNVPKRQYIGRSQYLIKILERRLAAEIMKGYR